MVLRLFFDGVGENDEIDFGGIGCIMVGYNYVFLRFCIYYVLGI